MSKSDPASGSRILLTDTDDVIASKIRKATVDSEIGISYDPEGRPGLSNLLHILSSLNGIEPSKLAQIHAKSSNQSFKELVADEIIQVLRPIRSEMYRLEKDPEFVLSVLEQGEAKARERAQKTMVRVKLALGLPESAPHL